MLIFDLTKRLLFIQKSKINNRHSAIPSSASNLKSQTPNLFSPLPMVIRVNDQWRIVFRWTDAGPAEVAIRDYH